MVRYDISRSHIPVTKATETTAENMCTPSVVVATENTSLSSSSQSKTLKSLLETSAPAVCQSCSVSTATSSAVVSHKHMTRSMTRKNQPKRPSDTGQQQQEHAKRARESSSPSSSHGTTSNHQLSPRAEMALELELLKNHSIKKAQMVLFEKYGVDAETTKEWFSQTKQQIKRHIQEKHHCSPQPVGRWCDSVSLHYFSLPASHPLICVENYRLMVLEQEKQLESLAETAAKLLEVPAMAWSQSGPVATASSTVTETVTTIPMVTSGTKLAVSGLQPQGVQSILAVTQAVTSSAGVLQHTVSSRSCLTPIFSKSTVLQKGEKVSNAMGHFQPITAAVSKGYSQCQPISVSVCGSHDQRHPIMSLSAGNSTHSHPQLGSSYYESFKIPASFSQTQPAITVAVPYNPSSQPIREVVSDRGSWPRPITTAVSTSSHLVKPVPMTFSRGYPKLLPKGPPALPGLNNYQPYSSNVGVPYANINQAQVGAPCATFQPIRPPVSEPPRYFHPVRNPIARHCSQFNQADGQSRAAVLQDLLPMPSVTVGQYSAALYEACNTGQYPAADMHCSAAPPSEYSQNIPQVYTNNSYSTQMLPSAYNEYFPSVNQPLPNESNVQGYSSYYYSQNVGAWNNTSVKQTAPPSACSTMQAGAYPYQMPASFGAGSLQGLSDRPWSPPPLLQTASKMRCFSPIDVSSDEDEDKRLPVTSGR